MIASDPAAHALAVLVAAPFRRDAAILEGILRQHGLATTVCGDATDLARQLIADSAALVMSQEALTPRMLDVVAGYLAAQPSWSELPLVLLLDAHHQHGSILTSLRTRLPSSKLTVLQRPVRALELVTTIQAAVASRRRQLQLRDHIVWQEELQRELNHRVKNILANVMAIYHMTVRQSASLEEFTERFEGRLTALSRVHHALVVSSEPSALSAVAELVLAPYRSNSGQRVLIAGPAIDVTPTAAATLALCLHELATNAAKYGALSCPQGRVALTWAFEQGEASTMVRLCWAEDGGPPVAPPSRRGYGTSFIRSAANGSLSGSVDLQFRPEGLVCRMIIPMATLIGTTGAALPSGEPSSASGAA
jgi:two-component sensor histidine kinase